jgi:[ribosomal protein S5]-alanine N-acetyltransferase
MDDKKEICTFIEGKKIYLRGLYLSDVNYSYHHWMNDPDVTAYTESRFYPHTMDDLRDYVTNINRNRDNVFLAILLRDGGRHIGNIKLGPINWIHRFADVALIIGEKDCWGKGYATEAIRLMVDYAFNKLNLHKLTAGCYETNQGSAKCFQKAGFTIEGCRKSHYFCNGMFVNAILLGLLNSKDVINSEG